MRITNQMTTNKVLLNLNRTSQRLDNLETQAITGKKIQYASEDPIIAALALKFRTNVSETVQYQSNVKQATSWLEATGDAITSANATVNKIRELCIQGASETYNMDNRKDISKAISEFSEQLTSDSNTTYAGRYIFGGYKTDKEVMFTEKNADVYTDITQKFTIDDIETIKVAVPVTMPMPAAAVKEVTEVSRIQLAYTDIDATSITGITPAPDVTTSTTVDAYKVADGQVKYISDTGELILGKNVASAMKTAALPINIMYNKTGFAAGDLNPQQYFDCKTTEGGIPRTFVKDTDVIEYEFGVNNKMQVNTEGSDVFTTTLIQDLRDLVKTIDGLDIRTESKIKTALENEDPLAYAAYTETELAAKIKEIQTGEEQTYRSVMSTRLNKVIGKIDISLNNLSTKDADIGSRINRLELVENRLGNDKVNYTDLMSDNENIDMESAYIEYSSQQTIYNSALKIGAQVMQSTLVDYIN